MEEREKAFFLSLANIRKMKKSIEKEEIDDYAADDFTHLKLLKWVEKRLNFKKNSESCISMLKVRLFVV